MSIFLKNKVQSYAFAESSVRAAVSPQYGINKPLSISGLTGIKVVKVGPAFRTLSDEEVEKLLSGMSGHNLPAIFYGKKRDRGMWDSRPTKKTLLTQSMDDMFKIHFFNVPAKQKNKLYKEKRRRDAFRNLILDFPSYTKLSDDKTYKTYSFYNKDILAACRTSPELKEVLCTGKYIFTEGLICLNRPDLFELRNGKYTIKDKVINHPEKYCLCEVQKYEEASPIRKMKFKIVQPDGTFDEYEFEYEVKTDHPFMELTSVSYIKPIEDKKTPDLAARLRKKKKFFSPRPDFGSTLTRYMNAYPITAAGLEDKIAISERTIQRYQANDIKGRPKTNYVVALCIGLDLVSFARDNLFECAGIQLLENGVEEEYILILSEIPNVTIHEANDYLISMGYQPLTVFKN